MFSALQVAGLTLKASKVQFGCKQAKYLGDVISECSISVGDDRISAIRQFPALKNIKELRSYLGTSIFVRSLIPDFSGATAPLVALTAK